MENDNRRDRLYEIIYKEMVGPEPIDFFMHDVRRVCDYVW